MAAFPSPVSQIGAPRTKGGELSSTINASPSPFLALLERPLPTREAVLAGSIRTARKIAFRTMVSEARETETIVAANLPELGVVLDALGLAKLPVHPIERLFGSSSASATRAAKVPDTLTATGRTP